MKLAPYVEGREETKEIGKLLSIGLDGRFNELFWAAARPVDFCTHLPES